MGIRLIQKIKDDDGTSEILDLKSLRDFIENHKIHIDILMTKNNRSYFKFASIKKGEKLRTDQTGDLYYECEYLDNFEDCNFLYNGVFTLSPNEDITLGRSGSVNQDGCISCFLNIAP